MKAVAGVTSAVMLAAAMTGGQADGPPDWATDAWIDFAARIVAGEAGLSLIHI